jgi:hypothetical protein
MTYTDTATETYTTVDIENVVRRFLADIVMIAQSSGAITEAKAREYAHDVEALAKNGYLRSVDLTLLSGQREVAAARYTVNTASGELNMSRPGGVRWARVADADFRIVLYYTKAYDDAARAWMKNRLKIGWTSTNADTSHLSLRRTGNRDYASNGWGLQREDYLG